MKTIIKELWKVQHSANEALFIEIFGKTNGNGAHLFYKFCKEERNILEFWKGLDDSNRELFDEYFSKQFVTMF